MPADRKTLYLLKELRERGPSFGLNRSSAFSSEACSSGDGEPLSGAWWEAEVEFPLTSELGVENAGRYELMIFHVRVHAGPWAGGHFRLQVDLRNKDYPFEPPSCQFLTRVWHPNVKESGGICHSYLRLPGSANPGTWSPVLRINTLVCGLVAMFDTTDPAFNPNSFLNEAAAEEFCRDRAAFCQRAALYTRQYATPVDWDRSYGADGDAASSSSSSSSELLRTSSKRTTRSSDATPDRPDALERCTVAQLRALLDHNHIKIGRSTRKKADILALCHEHKLTEMPASLFDADGRASVRQRSE